MDNEILSQEHQGDTNTLEVVYLRLQQEIPEGSYLKTDFKSWIEDKKRVDINIESSLDENEEYTINGNNDKESTQFITFQRAMKVILTYGQCVGLNPVTAILNHDITKIRFKLYSWRFLYTALIAIFQTLAASVTLYKLFTSALSIRSLVELIFFFTWKASEVLECSVLDYHTFEKIVDNMFPAFFEIGVPYNILTATLLQNFLSPSIWGTLREDYNRATRLIRRFDDVFSGLVLLSFAINLFWICLQIFNILENGIKPKPKSLEMCPHYSNPPFHGYEHSIFTLSSLTFLVARFTTMCLSAASVNVASLLPASVLYKVPSCSYSIEMAGTILTYELVLLQLSGEELDDS
ncbi:unnamed protein product [Arctia plantaginis]|uniref:Gustatory receptor n=1 Tax=Arctia plantaginis TaxID=874455 RepID=A0A8S0YP83_ARCPL|nr:unnamed protein product [Arctia plantaginis]